MSAKNFKFVSPGVFINEIDNSQLPRTAPPVGPVVIGRFRRGPAFLPTRVESLSELIQIFGEPIRGDEASDVWRGGIPTAPTYGAYAAAAWLKNGAPLTVIRVLGDQSSDATGTGAATAGWKMGDTPAEQDNPGGAYGLFLMNSSSFAAGVTGSVSGTLAASWYFNQGGIILSGTIAGQPTTIVSGSGVLIESDAGTGAAAQFTALLYSSGTTGEGTPTETVTFNFDRNSKYYARKVFNTNPTRTNASLVSDQSFTTGSRKPYFLGETFEMNIAQMVDANTAYGVILPLGDSAGLRSGNVFKKAATIAQTGWFMAQDLRTTDGSATFDNNTLTPDFDPDNPAICPRLFKFHTLTAGQEQQRKFKLSIENIKYSDRVDIDPYGSFSVVIRSIYDNDSAPRIVERFDNCNLNPNSSNYVARVVGDAYYEWDNTKKRIVEYGTYPNNSSIVRIELATDIDLGQADPELLPFGVQGPVKRQDFRVEFNSGSATGIYATASFLTHTASWGDPPAGYTPALSKLNVRRKSSDSFKWFDQAAGAAPDNAIVWGGGSSVATLVDAILANGSGDTLENDDTIVFTVPVGAGGEGTTTIKFGASADGVAEAGVGIIGIGLGGGGGTASQAAASIIAAINGAASAFVTAATSGNGSSGGVAGITAADAGSDKITITSNQLGSDSNSITLAMATNSILAGNAASVSLAGGTGADGQGTWLATVKFPDVNLRVDATDGNLSDPTLAYFGYSTTSGSVDTTFRASNLDLLRALPSDYGQFATDDYTKRMFVFSLDDVSASADGQSGTYSYASGSRRLGQSVTARNGSYKDVIDAGYDRFTVPMFGGFDGLDVTEAEPFNGTRALPASATESTYAMYYSVKKAIDILADPEFVEMNLVTIPGVVNESLTSHLMNVCEDRGDALAIVDPRGGYEPSSEDGSKTEQQRISATHVKDVVRNMQQRGLNSSYGCTYYPWVRITDDIGGGSLWAPPSVAAIGAMSFSDSQKALWFAPAGFNRGGLSRGAAGFPVTNVRSKLTAAERDDLYEANINPIASFPNEGIVIFGQKTLQVTPSALDRINVRRLMIFVKKQVSRIAANLLFEQNVEATWDRFKSQVDPFLSNIRSAFGLTDFKVVLDESTTTPELVDRNIMYAKIFLKPARSIEYIAIDFNITNTGASFDD
jgi:hypothetical protein